MLKACLQSFLLLLSLWLLSGPLALLQLGAWAWMVTSYSQESSFEQAVSETFSGERPCEMCKLITKVEAAADTQQPLHTTDSKELKLIRCELRAFTLSHPRRSYLNASCSAQRIQNPDKEVPSPPPREFV